MVLMESQINVSIYVKKICFLLCVIIVLIACVLFLYPSRSTILRGIQYQLTNEECIENFSLSIEPNKYKLSKEEDIYLVHQKLYDRFDTSIYFEKITRDTNRIHIFITTSTKWKLLGGSCLINVIVDNNNNKRGYTYILNKPNIYDGMGNQVRYSEIGTDASNFLIISFLEEEFYKHQYITVNFNRYNHLSYVLKCPFIKP